MGARLDSEICGEPEESVMSGAAPTDETVIEWIMGDMDLLEAFPAHSQRPEIEKILDEYRRTVPDLYERAEAAVRLRSV